MDILTASEISELLRLSISRVVLMAKRGELPAFRIDGKLRFDSGEIEEWLKSQRELSIGTRNRQGGGSRP